MARTEHESDRKREVAELLVPSRPAKKVQKGAGFHGKNLNKLDLLKKKGGLSATKRAVGKYARAAFAERERNRAVCTEHQIVRGHLVSEK